MLAKKILLIITFILLCSSASALVLSKHEINIQLGETTLVSEKYFLSMNPLEQQDFVKDVEENGKSLSKWKNDYEFIYPRFGDLTDITSLNVIFSEEVLSLELSYELNRSIASKVNEEVRTIKWALPDTAFGKFIKGTSLEIPEDTQIVINLPKNAILKPEEISKEINVQDSTLVIQGFRGSNLFIFYYTNKPIAPALDTEQLVKQFIANPLNQMIIGIIIALLIVLYIYRRPFVNRIEEYIVEHSELGEKEEESERE